MAVETIYPGAAVTIGRGLAASAFQYYLTGTENLRIEALSFGAAVTIRATWRLWREADRVIQSNDGDFVTTGFTGQTIQTWPLDAGALLSLRIGVTDPNVRLGTLWVRVSLIQGLLGATRTVATLLQGYVSAENDLAWPGSPLQSQHDGRGVIKALGWLAFGGPIRLEHSVSVGLRRRPIAGRFGFTAAAAGVARDLLLSTQDSTGFFTFVGTNGVQTAPGTRQTYAFGAGLAASGVTSAASSQLPFPSDLELGATEIIGVQVVNQVVGDVFDSAILTVREWIDS